MKRSATASIAGVALYYVIVGVATALLFQLWPALKVAISAARLVSLMRPADLPPEFEQLGIEGQPSAAMENPFMNPLGGGFPASVAMLGALLLVIPVAWVYTITKRGQRYEAAVLQSVIIMPIAVAGIVLIVQNSIALAFSLAGIVAAVRFRTTLKDTKDAVYIFVAIGVGLAAGVQALLVAFVMSIIFNGVVLVLWRFNVGDIYADSGGSAALAHPGMGPPGADPSKPFNGRLEVTAPDPDSARPLVEKILDGEVKRWERDGPADADGTFDYLVRCKKKTPGTAVAALINQRGAAQQVVATYEALEEE